MNTGLNFGSNKSFRLINIYERLNKGEILNKNKIAEIFGVTPKTIQRDIDDLRAYLAETHYNESDVAIKYSRAQDGYYLIKLEREWLVNQEVIAILKIILESRAFCKKELDVLINKLLAQVTPNDRKIVEKIIKSEQTQYIQLQHGKEILNTLWKLSQMTTDNKIITFTYTNLEGKSNKREVKPVALMFSEYYFYLIAYMADGTKDFPTIFRVDRMADLECMNKTFCIPYRDKFNDGEFRKRVQFMHSGELKRVKFEFRGSSLEALLDKLPTAEKISEDNGVYVFSVESYGEGVYIWLRSQGDNIKILEKL